ncbi:peptide/nickel transport system permease protein [Spinactinospora alkalitolerans]|uniref:Peptide/nickel transport system permease protein n=1 Tax=Spinactinospora alkalitolerans TaxID=687207 RepID=A0A852TXM2_9ACTN|nr:ABC transporter permease [Spinactinospora alkalitolerans]NYE48105.1 peptide/nickel transport system permease protein [Spinactinospora alkalitolerans]
MSDAAPPTGRPAAPPTAAEPEPAARAGGGAWRRFLRHRPAAVSLAVLGAVILAVVIGPAVIGYGPEEVSMAGKDQPPSPAHPMGTDDLGRDLLVRILVGGRLTLSVAFAAVGCSLVVGVLVGAVAGYFGGPVDNVLMRVVDVFYSLPALFVVILLVTLVGPGFGPIIAAVAMFSWMNTARLVRASYLSLKEKEFVEAARGIGAGHLRIAVRHILPGALGPIIVTATLGVATAILTESALSFLGLGFQPPEATWGGLLYEAQRPVIALGHWWRGFFPGAMLFIVVLAVNYVGDGLSDAFEPRRRKK